MFLIPFFHLLAQSWRDWVRLVFARHGLILAGPAISVKPFQPCFSLTGVRLGSSCRSAGCLRIVRATPMASFIKAWASESATSGWVRQFDSSLKSQFINASRIPALKPGAGAPGYYDLRRWRTRLKSAIKLIPPKRAWNPKMRALARACFGPAKLTRRALLRGAAERVPRVLARAAPAQSPALPQRATMCPRHCKPDCMSG